jgi:hypothetical protein
MKTQKKTKASTPQILKVEEIVRKEIQELYNNWYKNHIHHVPEKFFTKGYLLEDNELGISILHLAAKSGQLNQLPKKYLTQEYLCRVNSQGTSVMAIAASSGHFSQIPKNLWTKENLSQWSNPPVIVELAGTGDLGLLPPELLTQELLMTKDSLANTAFILAAREGKFEQIPTSLLSKEILLHEDCHKITLLDHIASEGQLHLIIKNRPELINYQTLVHKEDSPVLDSLVIYCEDNNCTKQLKLAIGQLKVEEIKTLLDRHSHKYPDKSLKAIKEEMGRVEKIGKLKKNLNKKINEISL